MSKDVETSGKYVLPSKLNYEDYLTAVGQRAQDSYDQAVKDAETARQKEVLAAGNAYRSALANSGANAAALSSMGLTGSGYSTYLDSQAYAQKQGAVNNAYKNKQSAVNLAKTSLDSALSEVEGSYAKYLVQQETDRKNAYQGIYDKLPTLSFGDIERLGATMGLDQPDIDALKAARNDMTYASLLGTEYGQKTLDYLVATGQLIDDRKTNPEGSKYESLLGGMMKLTDAEIANKFISDTETSGYVSYAAAEEALKGLESKIDSETYAKLKAQFDKDYSVTTVSGLEVVNEKKEGKDGKNIKVKDSNGNEYKVQYSGGEASGDVVRAAKEAVSNNKLSSGGVFMFRGDIYLYFENKCYKLEARMNGKGYNNLAKLFENSNKKTEGGSNTGTNTQNTIETNRFTAPGLPGYEFK